jgi:hypothetical protein
MEPKGPHSTAQAGDGALSLLALAPADAAVAADSTCTGQMHERQHPYCFLLMPCMLIGVPVSCACCCAGAQVVPAGAGPRRDCSGSQLCETCGTRLSRCKGKLYRSGAGKCCQSCYDAARPTAAPVLKQQRSKRPYDTLQSTQQWKRRTKARAAVEEALQQVGCPAAAVQRHSTAPPEELIHLPTSVREAIRSVPSLRIPSEQTMIKWKQQLATSHATETGTFAGGAFITDPVRYVSVLCAQSSFMAVGGDAGGDRCVLGVTYSRGMEQHFDALLVYEGGDSWLELQDCRAEGLTTFTGDSAAFPHIWAVLQHLIDTRGAFLNGDWPFLNAVLGLMAPAATHPCPICIISHNNFTKTARYRKAGDKHSLDAEHQPLLTIDPQRIVPTPLHLFLGISNRIILDAFSEWLGKQLVDHALKQVTTVHTAGCSGKSDLFDLNGPEIRKWIKKGCSSTLRAEAEKENELTAEQKASHSVLSLWLQQLHDHLLHKKEWTPKQIEDWRAAVDGIQQHWCAETRQDPFPKLHMLRHSLEFAERHRFLGRASEAQIESAHASFNSLFHKQHRNQAGNTAERLRRCLADSSLRAVQSILTSTSWSVERGDRGHSGRLRSTAHMYHVCGYALLLSRKWRRLPIYASHSAVQMAFQLFGCFFCSRIPTQSLACLDR